MRFKQIKKAPDSIMRKKLVVASALALGGVAMLGTATIVNAESVLSSSEQSYVKEANLSNSNHDEMGSNTKEQIDFELPDGLGKDDVLDYGKDGTANYIISKKGTLYFLKGELSVTDTKNIGRKYGQLIKKIETRFASFSLKTPENSSSLFADYFSNVIEFDCWGLDLSETKNASLMFANMTSLKYMDSLGISGSGNEYETTNMSGMFKNDSNLERVFLNSSLDTRNVTDMSEMFLGVSKLQNLDISGFDMRKVTNSNKIFEGTNLERITLGARNKFSKKDVIPNKNKLVWRAIDEDGNLEKDMTFSSYESNGHTLSEYYDGMGNKGRQTFIVNYHVLIIPSNLGDQVIENITVNSGNSVNVKVPVIKGYTADKKDVTAFINNYGTITTEEIVHYTLNSKPSESNNGGLQKPSNPSGTGNNSSSQTKPQKDKNNTIKANVTISTNLGDIKVQVSGKANEKKTVDVPQRDGYTSDKKTVTVLINANGTATTSESVKYIKNTTEVVRKNTLITTFNDKGNVILYNLDGTKLTRSDRMLASNTDWFSDRQVTIDGILYLRVATNEWIKGSNVYSYQSNIENVKTKRLAMLVNTHGQRVKDRALQSGTSWFTDRIVMINGNKYYRVATNELVSADDIY